MGQKCVKGFIKGAGGIFLSKSKAWAKLAQDRLEAFLCQARWRWVQGQPRNSCQAHPSQARLALVHMSTHGRPSAGAWRAEVCTQPPVVLLVHCRSRACRALQLPRPHPPPPGRGAADSLTLDPCLAKAAGTLATRGATTPNTEQGLPGAESDRSWS